MRAIPWFLVAVIAYVPARAATLVSGPFLRDVGTDRAVIAFETDVDTPAAVEVGQTDAYGTTIASPSAGTWHQVTVEGLPPKSLRHYRVLLDGAPAGRPGTFITAPSGPEPFTFLVYGDSRSNPDAHALVVARMAEHPASFFVNTGDLVSNGSKVEEWKDLLRITSELSGDMPFLATCGNHDLDGDGPPDSFIRYFGPVEPTEGPGTYRVQDWAGVRMIYLDRFFAGTVDVECFMRVQSFEFCFDARQMEWMKAQLEAARTDPAVKHVFIVVHEGPYSSKPDRNGAAELRMQLNDFARSKVRAILSGHDHLYERGFSGNGIPYVVSGGGGAPLYETTVKEGPTVPPHELVMAASTYNFQRVRVDGDRIEINTFDAAGMELEAFEIVPGPACQAVGDCPPPKAGWCTGAPECSIEGRCIWTCEPPPECSDEETTLCEMRTPVEDCPGAWTCVQSKCAWACDPPPETVPPDAGTADATEPEPGETDEGTATPDNPPATDPGTATDPGVTTPPESATPAGKGGGCSTVPAASPSALPLVLLVLAALGARFRASRRR